jgi:diguanylate cyclase (GGDEF)-like protein
MNEAFELRVSCQHELFLHLTRPRELSALNQALVEAIEGVCSGHALRLYEYRSALRIWQPAVGVAGAGDDGDRALLSGIDADHPLPVCSVAADDAGRICYPIRLDDELLGALVVEGAQAEVAEERLRVFLALYANQHHILSRSKRDALTDLLNRQAFDERIQHIYQQSRFQRRRASEGAACGWCLAILDIDHFKHINDSYGHLCGDDVLRRFARLMSDTFRDSDYLFRYGGEEFVVLLKDVDGAMAHSVLDRFRQKVAATVFPRSGHMTISIGYAPLNTAVPSGTSVSRADQALYAAKGAGRNCVVGYDIIGGRSC